MKEFTVPMALLDFVPVTLFFISCILIGHDLRRKLNTVSKVLYFAGFILVSVAGALKALYKLIYAAGAGDISWMSGQFFANESLGFLLAGAGLMYSLKDSKKKGGNVSMAIIPTAGLVALIVIGETAMFAALCRYASKLKKTVAIVLFVLAYFMSLSMGYLSSRDFDTASINWAAQGINTLGQLSFLAGALILHKAGLGKEEP